MIVWKLFHYSHLSCDDFYNIVILRQSVFIVEQLCPCFDIDEMDRISHHLMGYDESGNLIAYLRIVPPGFRFREPSLGRIVVRKDFRGKGIGRELVKKGLEFLVKLYPGLPARISAQYYLKKFYTGLGFVAQTDIYNEDGIPHIGMVYNPEI